MIRNAVATVVLLAAFAVGYGVLSGDSVQEQPAGANETSQAAVDSSTAAPSSPADLPDFGEMRVSWSGSLFDVQANHVPRAQLLRELARQGGFELLDRSTESLRVSLDARSAALEGVLTSVMGETPFAVHYAFEQGRGAAAPSSVVVGKATQNVLTGRDLRAQAERYAKALGLEVDEVEEALKLADDPEHAAAEVERAAQLAAYVPRELTPEERAAFERDRAARQASAQQEHYAATESPDPEARGFAVGTLDPTDPRELEMLAGAIDDPNAGVRREAAIQLSFGDADDVRDLIRAMLADDDPRVLKAVIPASSWADVRARAELEKLLDHSDREIRLLAQQALSDLNDS